MKARIKATGEIIDFICCELLDDEERKPKTKQEYNKANSSQATCNWVEVRNQAAIAAMQGILSNSNYRFESNPLEVIPKNAVILADELVKQLKGE